MQGGGEKKRGKPIKRPLTSLLWGGKADLFHLKSFKKKKRGEKKGEKGQVLEALIFSGKAHKRKRMLG